MHIELRFELSGYPSEIQRKTARGNVRVPITTRAGARLEGTPRSIALYSTANQPVLPWPCLHAELKLHPKAHTLPATCHSTLNLLSLHFAPLGELLALNWKARVSKLVQALFSLLSSELTLIQAGIAGNSTSRQSTSR